MSGTPLWSVTATALRRIRANKATRQGPTMQRVMIAGWVVLVVGASLAVPAQAGERDPIIDMHLHAWKGRWKAGEAPINPITGRASTATSGADLLPKTVEMMKRHNIVLGVAGGDLETVRRWCEHAPDRFIGSLMFPVVVPGKTSATFPLDEARAAVETGQVGALGEITAAYAGLAPNHPALDPFYALAEKHDIPVGIHLGAGRPGAAYLPCCAGHRIALGSPLLLEDVLLKYPKLRVWVMHAGYPMADEMIALLWSHPNVYADIGVLNWALPRAEFHSYLESLVRAGHADRIMFGSDQMFWPETIETAVRNVENASFLTEPQKRDIFYNNAARFLRLESSGSGTGEGSPREPENGTIDVDNGSRRVVLSLYKSLNQDRRELPLVEHAVRVVDAHFAESFVGHGGPDNHDYDLSEFRTIIRKQFSRFSDLRNSVEDVITEGNKTLVRIRLFDGQTEIHYMALYRVEAGRIVERWSFGDREFR